MSNITEEIKPFTIEEVTRRDKQAIDVNDTLYRQMKITMEAMEPNKKKGFTVPINGHKANTIRRFAKHIEESLNNLMSPETRARNPRVYALRTVKNENKIEVGIRVFRDQ